MVRVLKKYLSYLCYYCLPYLAKIIAPAILNFCFLSNLGNSRSFHKWCNGSTEHHPMLTMKMFWKEMAKTELSCRDARISFFQ